MSFGESLPKNSKSLWKMRKSALICAFSTEISSFLANFPQNSYSKNDQLTVGRGPPKEISSETDVFDLKRSEKYFCPGGPLIDDFWHIFTEISQFPEISKDLFFN